jgi:drug/metabolite transporter, DME family
MVQLAVPYWLMARGLRYVPSFEAGLLTLIEPVLNPLWAYLISPESERPTMWTVLGGVMILGTLAVRYWPRSSK